MRAPLCETDDDEDDADDDNDDDADDEEAMGANEHESEYDAAHGSTSCGDCCAFSVGAPTETSTKLHEKQEYVQHMAQAG